MPSVRCRPSEDTSSPNVIACSHIERTTDLGDSWWSATHGWPWAVGLVRGVEQLGERLGVGDLLEQLHPLLVLDALGLHRGHRLAAGAELLRLEHVPRVVEGRLHDRDDVERVGLRLDVEQLDGGQRERRERLVQSEVRREVDGEPDGAAGRVRLVQALDDAAGQQRAVGGDRLLDVPHLVGARLVVVQEQAPHRHERVAGAGDDVEQHRVRDDELGPQRLGVGRDQPVEGLLAPGDEALGRRLALHLAPLLRVVAGLGQRLEVVDLVVGRLDDDGARGVVAGPARRGPPPGGTRGRAGAAAGCRRTCSAR